MIDIDNIDDFPKLTPDESIRFEAKDELKHSPETIKLTPDMNIVMPDKESLKHRTYRWYLLYTSIAAAAILMLILIVTKDKSPVIVTTPEIKLEANIIVETKPESQPVIIPDKPSAKKSDTTATHRKPVSKRVAPETVEQDAPVETSTSTTCVPLRENIRIERITAASVPVEIMNKKKTIFVYQPDYRQSIALKAISNVASAVNKFSNDVDDAKQNISQMLDGFRLPQILGRLSLDRGIDREIGEWAKNNPDIPFDVFIDYSAENKMKEIYDENGTLLKVIFCTNKSLKYKSNKAYQVLNN
ncbi:MAG: hypothetical protein LBS55_06840 [Prevotellaceae bacterium]|jgi:hypothetical protein|nr:hypothetical protein [Prevotellaceae bacterium]